MCFLVSLSYTEASTEIKFFLNFRHTGKNINYAAKQMPVYKKTFLGVDWKNLYWGANVAPLMNVKNFWDKSDMFHHCQSLTSTNISCCPN